jgi:hypothetical protein
VYEGLLAVLAVGGKVKQLPAAAAVLSCNPLLLY